MNVNIKKILIVAAALVALIVMGRVFPHMPNFTPVAAVAIFSAFFFRNRLLALSVPFAGMVAADYFIGSGYSTQIMIFVYAGLMFPALFGPFFRKQLSNSNGLMKGVKITGFALAASTFFFLVSNFGEWYFGSLYAGTAEGLLMCYVKAIPFYKATILGDLVYSFGIFGAYFAATQLAASKEQQPA